MTIEMGEGNCGSEEVFSAWLPSLEVFGCPWNWSGGYVSSILVHCQVSEPSVTKEPCHGNRSSWMVEAASPFLRLLQSPSGSIRASPLFPCTSQPPPWVGE
jgi:hypothetical protein